MARFYTMAGINKAYSDKVAQFLAEGFTVFTPTMGGSQGELAHIHLINPDHSAIYAVLLEKEHSFGDGYDHKMVVRVVCQTAQDLRCNKLDDLLTVGGSSWCTFWNDKGTEVYRQTWYAMVLGNTRDYSYTLDEDVPKKAEERRDYKYSNGLYKSSGSGQNIPARFNGGSLVQFVRRHGGRGYGNTRLEEIKSVFKFKNTQQGRMRYVIKFMGSKKDLIF